MRDSERKAALMHFSTDQARELTLHAQQADQPEHPPNPRAEQVKSMAKPATGRYTVGTSHVCGTFIIAVVLNNYSF